MNDLDYRLNLRIEADYSLGNIRPDEIRDHKLKKSFDVRSLNERNLEILKRIKPPGAEEVDRDIKALTEKLGLITSPYTAGRSDLVMLLQFADVRRYLPPETTSQVRAVLTTCSNNFSSYVITSKDQGSAILISDVAFDKMAALSGLVPLAFSRIRSSLLLPRPLFAFSDFSKIDFSDPKNYNRFLPIAQDFALFPIMGRSPHNFEADICLETHDLLVRIYEYVGKFVLLHELGHIALDHVKRARSEHEASSATPLRFTEEDVRGTFLEQFYDPAALARRQVDQRFELEADSFAIDTLFDILNQRHHGSAFLEEAKFAVFAIGLFLGYCFRLQSADIFYKTGYNPAVSEILGVQHEIESLFFCSSHPSPIHRFNAIVEQAGGKQPEPSFVEAIYGAARHSAQCISIPWSAAEKAIQRILDEEGTDLRRNFFGAFGDAQLASECLLAELRWKENHAS